MCAVRYHAILRRSTSAAAAAVLSLSALAAGPPDRFDDLFARTLARRQTIRSIRARFTEITTSSLLQNPIVAHGTVVAAPPYRVLMTYTDPERRTIVIDGKTLVVAWPDRAERETIDVAQALKRTDHYFTRATADELRSVFDVQADPDAARPGTDRVEMRPKRKQIKEGLERLDLWIDRESLLLVEMQMTFPGGDRKTIRLDDITTNVPVTDDTFRIR
jgi:outer membrane lipoprotein-sorting protein